MDDYISREAVINITAETGAWETQNRVRELPAADVQPVKQWYSVEENQPDSVGDDVLVVDSYGKYHIAYYLSGSENWMNQDTREPIKDVVKWRYLGGDSE